MVGVNLSSLGSISLVVVPKIKTRSDSKKKTFKIKEGTESSTADVLPGELADVSMKKKVRFNCWIVLATNWENNGFSEDAHILISIL